MNVNHVPGKNKGRVMLYALSTCVWCKKTKKLLDELGVEYNYIDVDLLEGKEEEKVMKEIKHWNPNTSFPTIVINDDKCILGFDEVKIKKEIGND